MVLIEKNQAQRELVSIIALLEENDLAQALRRLRALHVSLDLQERLQRTTLDALERVLNHPRKS